MTQEYERVVRALSLPCSFLSSFSFVFGHMLKDMERKMHDLG